MCKAIALTFSKKNQDIYQKIMDRDKSKYKNNTDYICAAIRAFQVQEDNNNETITKNDIELIVNNALVNFKYDLLNSNINLSADTNRKEYEDNKLELLEENLNSNILNIDED